MAITIEPRSGAQDGRYRQAMQATAAALALVDARGNWLELNPAFEALLGQSGDVLRGGALDRHLDAAGQVAASALLARAAASQDAVEGELHWRHHDGHTHATRMRMVALRDSNGALDAVLMERLESLRAPTGRHPLQLFADAIAHDLRAPLRSIDSFAGLLAKRAQARLDDTDRDHLARIRKAAERMGSLLAALSDLSLAMRAELRPAPVDMSLLAEWVGAELHDAHRSADTVPALQIQPGLTAWGDERLLKLMLVQLIGNAWKFSRGCDTPQVRIDGECDGRLLRVAVRDAGCGFDMQYAHKLFEPFQRLHGAEQGAGHGLGLAIAQCIAQRHGGRIHAQSQPQAGSVFTIELPAVAAAPDAPHA